MGKVITLQEIVSAKIYTGTPRFEPGPCQVMVAAKGEEYPLDPRHDLANHSPDGFAWGYLGSSAAQLALAILADATGNDDLARAHYQRFKREVVAKFPQRENFTVDSLGVRQMVDRYEVEAAVSAHIDGPAYREIDVLAAAPGHMPLVGTNIEVVAYRNGDDLVLLVNKGACIYRALLKGAIAVRPGRVADATDTFVIRELAGRG